MARGIKVQIKLIGGTWSFIWSIGNMPLIIMSAFERAKLGMTKPGQSQSKISFSKYSVCKNSKRNSNRGEIFFTNRANSKEGICNCLGY